MDRLTEYQNRNAEASEIKSAACAENGGNYVKEEEDAEDEIAKRLQMI